MKKDNKSQENIYLLMKERLGKYMNEGVEQDLQEFLNFVSEQKQEREESGLEQSLIGEPTLGRVKKLSY